MLIDFAAISSFLVLAPFLVGVIIYNQLPRPGRYVTWLLAAWFVAEIFAYALRVNGYSNWNVYVLLSFGEIVIITMFYKDIFVSRRIKSIIIWIACMGLGLVSAEYVLSESFDNTFTMLFECLFFFGMGLYAFYEMIIHRTSSEYSLLVGCIMVLFLGSAVYFSTWKFMKHDESLFRLFGHAHSFLLVGCYGLFTYSLWRLRL